MLIVSIVLPALAVPFAAFCVWLGVRIVNRRERWAKWTLAGVLGVPVLYALSFGPACWLVRHNCLAKLSVAHVYFPIVRYSRHAPRRVFDVVLEYAGRDEWDGATFVYLNLALLAESEGLDQ
jgi:hypothetical protein